MPAGASFSWKYRRKFGNWQRRASIKRKMSSFIPSASQSVAMLPGPMTEVAKQALAITEANLRASFDHARKLMQARDINDVMQLQSEYLRTQFASATDQFKQRTSGTISAHTDAINKVTT